MSERLRKYEERPNGREDFLNQSNEIQLIEILEQEKYSLELQLNVQKQSTETLAADVEYFEKENKAQQQKLTDLEKEVFILKQRNDNFLKEKQDFEKAQEELQLENSNLKKRISVLELEIKNSQNTTVLNETVKFEESPDTAEYEFKIKNLEDILKELNHNLDSSKQTEKRLNNTILELEETLRDLNKELSFQLQRNKEQQESIEELHCENEVLKLNQLDVNKRGNSMFAELDDRRKYVESIFKELQQKHFNLLKNYDEKDKELKRIQGRIAYMSSMTSKRHHEEQNERLSCMLSRANYERRDLMHKLERAERLLHEHEPIQCPISGDQYNYLRRLYETAQKDKRIAEGESLDERNKVLELSQEMANLNQKLFSAENELSEVRCENLKLKQKIKDLTDEPEVYVPPEPPKIEYLPGFENKPKDRTEKENIDPDDYIPGKFLMTENGFVEISKPRLTNRARFRKYFEEKAKAEEEAKASLVEGALKEANPPPDSQSAPESVEQESVELESVESKSLDYRGVRSADSKKKQVQCAQQ